MPRASGLPFLNLSPKNNEDLNGLTPATLSPRSTGSPHTPGSAPGSPYLQGPPTPALMSPLPASPDGRNDGYRSGPTSPRITAMPEFPPSPVPQSPKHGRDMSKGFFSNFMASKSSHKLQPSEANIQEDAEKVNVEKVNARSRTSSKDRSLHSVKKQESTPELPQLGQVNGSTNSINPSVAEPTIQRNPPEINQGHRKARSKFGGILARTKTVRLEDTTTRQRSIVPSQLQLETKPNTREQLEPSPKTAPLKSDYRDKVLGNEGGIAIRNRSADRQIREESGFGRRDRQNNTVPLSSSHSSSFREGSTLQILSNIGHTGKGMGDRLGKAGKGFLGKITRSGSSNEHEPLTDDSYVCTTINLPLVKQTRKTRIARRLELSKDKTEFWMPALPWRCIDYLNMNGSEEEGLYRIPGSGRDVKHWQRRFDTEYDINLFDEPDLYDINTIGSMFKSWLRELPDEILPKSIQNKVATQCAGATSAPQLMKDELSRLPPFNYYLLFAITCHLSLLHSYADKNKMDYRNLCICFQPCLKIDAFCFQFLVMDWTNCWQGCWTEKEYLEEEYRYEREGSVNESEDLAVDDRAISSSGSSQQQAPAPAPPRSADAVAQRKSMAPKTKQRSLSSGASGRDRSDSGHATAQSVPAVPRVTTPEPPRVSLEQKLPELTGLSPIRM
ncbi:RalA-binding protein 1 [Exophiala viscosa]|uniref:RalA-binding protein 1 n=1 Tax=Exophiala viscosa TaxID=2486360 RepID=A0AAN6IGG0_9EURO|nr:RalA-binding protein 1 [Exophiala viscosa]